MLFRSVVTDLLNFGMPFIRYKLGDMAAFSGRQCPCGRGLPLIEKLAGRTADQFITPGGKRISPGALVLYLVDQAPGVMGQVQIIQDALEHLTLRYTPAPPLSTEIMQYQESKIRSLFGEEMKVSFEQVPEIPKESSGKYLFTKCLVDKDGKKTLE